MAPSDELNYLKELVKQLNDKIAELERRTKDALPISTSSLPQQLRMILIGPPGAGEYSYDCVHYFFEEFKFKFMNKERELKRRKSRRNSAFVI